MALAEASPGSVGRVWLSEWPWRYVSCVRRTSRASGVADATLESGEGRQHPPRRCQSAERGCPAVRGLWPPHSLAAPQRQTRITSPVETPLARATMPAQLQEWRSA